MRVLDDPQDIAERIEHRRDPDAAAHVLNALVLPRSQAEEPGEGCIRVGHSPVGLDAPGPWLRALAGRVQSQLEAADAEADVERLVEVGCGLEHGAVPGFRLLQIVDVVDRGTQSKKRLVVHGLTLLLSGGRISGRAQCEFGYRSS